MSRSAIWSGRGFWCISLTFVYVWRKDVLYNFAQRVDMGRATNRRAAHHHITCRKYVLAECLLMHSSEAIMRSLDKLEITERIYGIKWYDLYKPSSDTSGFDQTELRPQSHE